MIHPDMVEAAIAPLRGDDGVGCVNLARRLDDRDDYENPDTIKVVTDIHNNAMYMTRAPIPTLTKTGLVDTIVLKQVCVIVFSRSELELYTRLAPTPLEQYESVDMLRLMEHGRAVHMVPTVRDTAAIDRPEDVARVEELLRKDTLVTRY